MSFKKTSQILVIAILFFLGFWQTAQAGFGISPPDFRNENLTRGSYFEQKIVLVRGDPIEDWKVEIITNVPGADKWISVDKGKEFIMPEGAQQVPIIFSVDVPKDAKFGRYVGSIRVKTAPVKPPEEGTVSILLGGQIDVDLGVVEKKIFDFKVRGVKVFDLEEGHKFWWRYVPGKIKFSMKIENLGNVKIAPTRVYFDIYDTPEQNLLESMETTKMSSKAEPFETKEIIAELSTKLPAGSYWARFKAFKGEEIAQGGEGKIHLSILPYGTLPVRAGLEFAGLPIWIWIAIGIFIMVLAGGGFWWWRRKNQRKTSIVGLEAESEEEKTGLNQTETNRN